MTVEINGHNFLFCFVWGEVVDNDYWIPRTLDDGVLFFKWHMDVVAVGGIFVFFGLMMKMYLVFFTLAYLVGTGYSRLKYEGGVGLIQRFLFWFAGIGPRGKFKSHKVYWR